MQATIVESLPIRDQIADIMRKMIITGELKGGERISERQIGMLFQVSTTPVKEAFRILEAERLIVCIPRKGSFVSMHSKESLLEMAYLRSAVDGVAAYFAAKNASQEQKDFMNKMLQQARTIILEEGDINQLSQCNDYFHSCIREASNNAYLCKMSESFVKIDSSIRKIVNVTDMNSLMTRQLEHEEIYKAIEEGDSEKVEQLMVHHIRRGTGKFFNKN